MCVRVESAEGFNPLCLSVLNLDLFKYVRIALQSIKSLGHNVLTVLFIYPTNSDVYS